VSERFFLDTNVLVYAADHDSGEKRERGREILRRAITTGLGVVSTQVLQEYFVVATRKLRIDAAVARREVSLFAALDVVQVDVPQILAAIDLHRLHGFRFWDALILRCASVAGCARLLTEDLQHDQVLEGLRIENPFLGL
jgi:predicted nucleic acid-binding protein